MDEQTSKETIASVLRDTQNTAAIMRELSDLKSSLAINSTETTNIKITMNEVKADVKEIKNDFVNRREHNELVAQFVSVRNDVETLKEFKWKFAGITSLAAALMTFVGQLIIKYMIR